MNMVIPEAVTVTEWAGLVGRIRAGESDGMAELYELFSKRTRFYFWRHLQAQELDDRVHDAFVVVVQAIQRGEIREPERLPGFVKTVSRRQMAAHIDQEVRGRREHKDLNSAFELVDSRSSPEQAAIFGQRSKLIRRVLAELPERDREILTRFYLREQEQDQICTEMALTGTQFRLMKSRAMARFGKLGKRRLMRRSSCRG